jgi:hypothetical protein
MAWRARIQIRSLESSLRPDPCSLQYGFEWVRNTAQEGPSKPAAPCPATLDAGSKFPELGLYELCQELVPGKAFPHCGYGLSHARDAVVLFGARVPNSRMSSYKPPSINVIQADSHRALHREALFWPLDCIPSCGGTFVSSCASGCLDFRHRVLLRANSRGQV